MLMKLTKGVGKYIDRHRQTSEDKFRERNVIRSKCDKVENYFQCKVRQKEEAGFNVEKCGCRNLKRSKARQ